MYMTLHRNLIVINIKLTRYVKYDIKKMLSEKNV